METLSAKLKKYNKMANLEADQDMEKIIRGMIDLSTQRSRKTKAELIQRSTFLMDILKHPNSISVPGERAFAYNKHRSMSNLPGNFPTRELLEGVAGDKNMLINLFPVLQQNFTIDSYSKLFSALLQIEEAYAMLTLCQYDMDCVHFRKEDGFFVLDVPGLAQGRPSLLPGDIAVCYEAGLEANCPSVLFEGVIHKTSQEAIFLKFHSEFMRQYDYRPYNVCFRISRTIVRRLHGALNDIEKDCNRKQILFPERILFQQPMIQLPQQMSWFNKALNPRQKQAVKCILEGKCRPSPYIVVGPPGTGKTVTIVEAILQIFTLNPNSRILACSGSNSAADSIATKLVSSGNLQPNDLVRIMAFSRWDHEATPENILPYSQLCQEGNQANWLNHRIVVSTCANTTKFGVFSKGTRDFDYVFIDEASTVTEPESLLVILLASLKKQSLVVLAGDPHQLGPVVISPHPGQLETPLIERLCSFEPYHRNVEVNKEEYGYYDPRCLTKLIQCYRCPYELIQVNSKLFYHSELKSDIKVSANLLKNFKNFPIIFHGVDGKDSQMHDSPSWFNYKEAISVTKYLVDLFKAKVKANQIAIITPYRKQVEVINALLLETFKDPKKVPVISTVESFQGLEKRVVILSLVRSGDVLNLKHDTKYNIGFLNSPKRFNVATSRAKQLMIVIGNPNVLYRDFYWQHLVEYCCQNGSYSGCPFDLPAKVEQVDPELNGQM